MDVFTRPYNSIACILSHKLAKQLQFTLIKKVDSKHVEVFTNATIELLKLDGDRVCSITADNGKECAGHEIMCETL